MIVVDQKLRLALLDEVKNPVAIMNPNHMDYEPMEKVLSILLGGKSAWSFVKSTNKTYFISHLSSFM